MACTSLCVYRVGQGPEEDDPQNAQSKLGDSKEDADEGEDAPGDTAGEHSSDESEKEEHISKEEEEEATVSPIGWLRHMASPSLNRFQKCSIRLPNRSSSS